MSTFTLARAFAMTAALVMPLAPSHATDDAVDWEARIRSMAVSSPYRIPPEALQGKLRYWLRFDGADMTLPETGEQHVERLHDGWVVTVCADCGRETPPDASTLETHRMATEWLPHRDPDIRRMGQGSGSTLAQVMPRLIRLTQMQLRNGPEFARYLDAASAYDAQRGDCTEFALLLAAAARAHGFPTRVVAGISYSSRFVGKPHAFGPHMWVQVWNGEDWVSHDAALGHFDSGHVAFVLGDGSPERMRGSMRMLARLRIEQIAAVNPAAAVDAARP